MDHTLLEQAHVAVKIARECGADEVAAQVGRSRGVDLEWRDGRLERVQEQTRRSLGIELYVDHRYSASSTNDLRPDALRAFIAESVANTRLLEPDEHRGLPDPARYEGRVDVELDMTDSNYGDLDGAARRKLAADLETIARDGVGDVPIISVSTGAGDQHGETARVQSNGFEGTREGTSFSHWAMVTLKEDDGRRPMGAAWSSRRHRADLDPIEFVARDAQRRAIEQLGAGKLPTDRYTVVVENRAIPRLVGALLSPLSGAALQQQRSLWEGRVGTRIVHERLSISDDPHRVRGMGSALWDGDGFATQPQPIIEAGVLKLFFIDQYYARKLGVEPTTGGSHNLDWSYGDHDAAALIRDVGDGVFINSFLGGNSNETTGELSFGCSGRVIRNGALAEPVQEINLADNFGDLWMRLAAIGNDPDQNSSASCPTCIFEGVQLSGA